jgi:hypothetical protein
MRSLFHIDNSTVIDPSAQPLGLVKSAPYFKRKKLGMSTSENFPPARELGCSNLKLIHPYPKLELFKSETCPSAWQLSLFKSDLVTPAIQT